MSKNENTTATTDAKVAAEKGKIVAAEATLQARYPGKVVPGSVRRAPEGSPWGTKLICEINTIGADGQPDGKTRTVATSDVFQVHHQPEVFLALRKQRQAEKRRAKAAARKAEKAEKGETEKATTEDAADALGV